MSAERDKKIEGTTCMGTYYVLNTYYVLYFIPYTHTGLNKARYSYTQLYRAIHG